MGRETKWVDDKWACRVFRLFHSTDAEPGLTAISRAATEATSRRGGQRGSAGGAATASARAADTHSRRRIGPLCRLPCPVCRLCLPRAVYHLPPPVSCLPAAVHRTTRRAKVASPSWDKIGSCSEPFGAIAAKLLSSIRTNIFSLLPTLLDARLHFCVHTQTMTPEDARDGTARPRRSSRAVAKPDFRAMENYGDLTSKYGDDLFVARDPSPSHASRSAPHHARRPSGGSGGSGGRGMKKVGGGNVTKGGGGGRRPPVVEEMEQHAKKLEQDVAALQARRREVRGQLEAVLRENEKLRSELNAGKGEGGGNTKREQDDVGGIKSAGGGLLY